MASQPSGTPTNPPESIRWWKSGRPAASKEKAPQQGQPCPKCLLGDLALDSLFRLRCTNCEYVADCGAFT